MGIKRKKSYVAGIVLKQMNTFFDLFQPELSTSAEVHYGGFSHREGVGEGSWCWGLREAFIQVPRVPLHGLLLEMQLLVPIPGQCVELRRNGSLWLTLEHRKEPYTYKEEVDGPLEIQFRSSHWNQQDFAPNDARDIAFQVLGFSLSPRFAVEEKLCPYPFSRMEMPGEPFVPCCQSWLRPEYFQLPTEVDAWNGEAAQALRSSILDGSYRYCYLDRCRTHLVEKDKLREFAAHPGELPIAEENLAAIEQGQTYMPKGPSAATLMGDPRCNLACSSCRKEKITALLPVEEKAVASMQSLLDRYARDLEILKVAGDGEVFFSPVLQQVVRSADIFPRLQKLDILTNGILLNERKWEQLQPGIEKVKSINISLDAGDEETYRRVRGGDWSTLGENLAWASRLRKERRLEFLGFTFVLRAANYRSLPAFLELAEQMAVDEVYVSQLLPWERMLIRFEEEAIHLPSHSQHGEFRELWQRMRAKDWSFHWRTSLS